MTTTKGNTMTNDYGPSREFACADCGRAVHRRTSKAGKRYTAEYFGWSGTETFAERTFYRSHACTPVEGWREAQEAREAEAIACAAANGQIIKGVTVEVIKGRKVAIGTTGVVFWVADRPDDYDTIKVGFKTAEGDKHFININNVQIKGE
jgi:hypothetical protein